MMIYKKIMVAIDGSDVSNNALQEAIRLAINQKAHLRILHVLDEGAFYFGGAGFDYISLIAALREEGQAILDSAVKLITDPSSIKFDCSLVELKPLQGRVAELIVDEAKNWSADLLVIGTHGRRGFSHLFLGSVAEHIIRIASTPILLIKGHQN